MELRKVRIQVLTLGFGSEQTSIEVWSKNLATSRVEHYGSEKLQYYVEGDYYSQH